MSKSMQRINVTVSAIEPAARNTNIYELCADDDLPLPTAEAGAHVDIFLSDGISRQYSLIRPEENPRSYLICVKRDPASRGGSQLLHDRIRIGSRLAISAPRNNFPLNEATSHSVLIAGGIGITPIWSMIQRLEALSEPWELHYACRGREYAAFLDRLEELGQRVFLHFDDEYDGRLMDLPIIVSRHHADPHLYCCEPGEMPASFRAFTSEMPSERIHYESFVNEARPACDGGFVVALASSGLELSVPSGKTVLDVLLEAGIPVSYSCQEGFCGTCETRVIAGVPDHRDGVLTDRERARGDTMMICCSGCKGSRLVLDL